MSSFAEEIFEDFPESKNDPILLGLKSLLAIKEKEGLWIPPEFEDDDDDFYDLVNS